MHNPNTPVQPNDHEVRTFRVGPVNGANYLLLPEQKRRDIERVAAGEAGENDEGVNVVTQQVSRALTAVREAILDHARAYLLNEGLSLAQVQASVERLQQESGLELPGEVTAEFREGVLLESLENILFGVKLALEEILINHEKHGNRDPRKAMGGRYWINEEGELHIVSWDSGEGFHPEGVPDPTHKDTIERPNGRGRMLSLAFTDFFEDGAEGPTGKMGTSVHMMQRLRGLDAIPHDEDQPHGISVLDGKVKAAVQAVLQKQAGEERQQREVREEREKRQRLRKSWFGLRQKLAKWLQDA